MPGRRSDARERADHARDVAQRVRSLYAMLTTQLPLHERALIGRDAILDYLHTTLLLRRPNGGPVTWRMVLRWRRDHGFPLAPGAPGISPLRSPPRTPSPRGRSPNSIPTTSCCFGSVKGRVFPQQRERAPPLR
jgi:hypothetical protein